LLRGQGEKDRIALGHRPATSAHTERSDIHELWRWLSMMVSRDDYYQPIKLEMSAYKEPPKEKICEHCGASYSTGNIGKIGTTHAALAGGDASSVTDIGSTPTVPDAREAATKRLIEAAVWFVGSEGSTNAANELEMAVEGYTAALQQGKGEGE
jgi:hypothetical protein